MAEKDVAEFIQLIKDKEGKHIERWKMPGYMKNLVQYLFDRQSYKIFRELHDQALSQFRKDAQKIIQVHFAQES